MPIIVSGCSIALRKHVHAKHPEAPDALRARGQDVRRLEHLDDRAAQHPHVERQEDDRRT